MRLAYLAQSVVPSRSANSVHVMKMCAAFSASGHDVTLIVPETGPSGTAPDPFEYYGIKRRFGLVRIPVIGHGGSRWRYLYSAFRLQSAFRKALRELAPDRVYGRSVTGVHAAAGLGIPFGLEVHQPVWNGLVEGWLFRRIVADPSFEGLVTITRALADMYIDHGCIARDRVVVAPDAADEPGAGSPVKLRGARQGALQVGYTGSLHPGRGVGLMVELARRFPDMDFHLVGGDAGDVLGRLPDLPANVFFHGYVPPSEVDGFRTAFDVLLAPYGHSVAVDGGLGDTAAYCSPLKLFEYMASGRPMIVSDLPVFREVLDESLAVLVPPADPDAWAEALAGLRDPGRRAALAGAARDRFLKRHTWTARAEAIGSALGWGA